MLKKLLNSKYNFLSSEGEKSYNSLHFPVANLSNLGQRHLRQYCTAGQKEIELISPCATGYVSVVEVYKLQVPGGTTLSFS